MEFEEQNSPKRSWLQTANTLRERYLASIERRSGGHEKMKKIKRKFLGQRDDIGCCFTNPVLHWRV